MEKENLMPVQNEDYASEIVSLLSSDAPHEEIKEQLLQYHQRDIATALHSLDGEAREGLYAVLDDDTLASVLEYTEDDELAEYLDELTLVRRARLLELLEPSLAVAYLKELDRRARHEHFRLMSAESKESIFLLSSFDEDEIGSKMSDNYITVSADAGVRGVMSSLVSQAAQHDNVSTIYVVGEGGIFVGAIDLKDLIVARTDTPLDDIIKTNFPVVHTEELISDCARRLTSYSEESIPVLDENDVLVGVLTSDILTDLTREDIEEDYARLAGLGADEDDDEGLVHSVKQRLPWLAVLFFLGFLVSGVVGIFESVMSELTLLVSFQSLILGMAGNVGTQSLAVTIRMLSDERQGKGARLRRVLKEMAIGLLNGSLMAALSFVLVLLYLCVLRGVPVTSALLVAMSIAIALILSMLLSGMFGALIPMFFGQIGIDPAVASGPFITTVSDLVAVVTYYGLAGLLIGIFL